MIGRCMVPGRATGDVLYSDVPLSFWMGIDVNTGEVIDRHHPLCGEVVTGKIVVLPSGRGSCSGSCALLELIMNGRAPAALVFGHDEIILTLGAIVAGEIFGKSIPITAVGADDFESSQTSASPVRRRRCHFYDRQHLRRRPGSRRAHLTYERPEVDCGG